jgi:hypothetical protein
MCAGHGASKRDTITLASAREQASVASPVRLSQWTRRSRPRQRRPRSRAGGTSERRTRGRLIVPELGGETTQRAKTPAPQLAVAASSAGGWPNIRASLFAAAPAKSTCAACMYRSVIEPCDQIVGTRGRLGDARHRLLQRAGRPICSFGPLDALHEQRLNGSANCGITYRPQEAPRSAATRSSSTL